MQIPEREPGDIDRLNELLRTQVNAKQRDRYRAVLLAIQGQEANQIALMLGRARRFVQRWAYVYRDHGIGAIGEKPRPGRPTKLARDQEQAFIARLEAGPTDADGGVCTLRGKDAIRILAGEFNARYSLGGIYGLLDRLKLSCLKPRPVHPKNDKPAMAAFKGCAPFLSASSARSTPSSRSRSGSRTRPASVSRAR